jgi:hypothetical protein
MLSTTMPRRGLAAALLSALAWSHSFWWQSAQPVELAVVRAGPGLWPVPAAGWSVMPVWQATHCILACTLPAYLSGAMPSRARALPSAAGTSSLCALASCQQLAQHEGQDAAVR